MTGLNEILRDKGVSHLIVCGVTTEAKRAPSRRPRGGAGGGCGRRSVPRFWWGSLSAAWDFMEWSGESWFWKPWKRMDKDGTI